ncbi:MAG: hypothetical protein K2P81_10560 [Bacteriovoracaceae bacterium]|nr:hypothetical protein [Bacteriovoracaceae bacterium]
MEIKSVVVIGAGTMGSGIAQWFAQQNVLTYLCDNNPNQTETALKKIHESWSILCKKSKISTDQVDQYSQNIKTCTLDSIPHESDLIIEAIIENLEIKKNLFKSLDQKVSSHSIFASNTSSFPIGKIGDELSDGRKKKFVGLHFFNPATLMKLVEIVQSKDSSLQICQQLYQWFDSHGKKPALCSDSPGFIVNRVARSFYGEPLRIAGRYDEEKIKEIDQILKTVGDFKMGPFELMDLIGVEVNYSVTCSVWESYNKSPRFSPHSLQKELVDRGYFGRKTKKGFYQYE